MNQLFYIISFSLIVVVAILCGALAKSKKRDPFLWSIVGLMSLGIGLLILLILPEAKEGAVDNIEGPLEELESLEGEAVASELQEMVQDRRDDFEKKLIPNYRYYTTADFRVCQVEFRRKNSRYTGQLVARSYKNKVIQALKVRLNIKNIFGEAVKTKDLTFRFGEMDEVGWDISSRESLDLSDIKLSTFRTVDIEVMEVKWQADSYEKINQRDGARSSGIGKLKTLRKAFGADVFSDFVKGPDGEGFQCICGFINAKTVSNCNLCGRSRELIEGSRPKGGLVELLNNCDTIEEAEEVVKEHVTRIPANIGDKLIVRIEHDKVAKSKNDQFNDKEKIDKYIEIAMELLVKG